MQRPHSTRDTLHCAQRIAIPYVNVTNMNLDGAAYVASTVFTLFTDMSVMHIWAVCFAVFVCATIALLIRVSTIPPVVLPDEVPHTGPRPPWQLEYMFGRMWQRVVLRVYRILGGGPRTGHPGG